MAKSWAKRYEGYALRQATAMRNQIAAEVTEMRHLQEDPEKIERAEARLASWDELLLTYVKAKKSRMTILDDLIGGVNNPDPGMPTRTHYPQDTEQDND